MSRSIIFQQVWIFIFIERKKEKKEKRNNNNNNSFLNICQGRILSSMTNQEFFAGHPWNVKPVCVLQQQL